MVSQSSRMAQIRSSRRGLPGDPEDKHSRHIEALINGVSLSTHRQSSARPEVRLQTAMVGTLDEHPEELLSEHFRE
jgi:hypothetical protein